jgi:hypothetical protein
MDIKEKYCSGCKETLSIENFFRKKRIYKDRVYYDYRHLCKKCHAKATNKYDKEKRIREAKYCACGDRIFQKKNDKCPKCNIPDKREKGKLRQRGYRDSKPYKRNDLSWMTDEQQKAYKAKKMRIYRRRKPEIIKAIQTKQYVKDRNNLTDSYIKKMIQNSTGISYKLIPSGLIELQRAQIKLTRTIKERCKNGKD